MKSNIFPSLLLAALGLTALPMLREAVNGRAGLQFQTIEHHCNVEGGLFWRACLQPEVSPPMVITNLPDGLSTKSPDSFCKELRKHLFNTIPVELATEPEKWRWVGWSKDEELSRKAIQSGFRSIGVDCFGFCGRGHIGWYVPMSALMRE